MLSRAEDGQTNRKMRTAESEHVFKKFISLFETFFDNGIENGKEQVANNKIWD